MARWCAASIVLFVLFTYIRSDADYRFKVYWNVPTDKCYTLNVSIPLAENQITANDKLAFIGNKIVCFYEAKTGLFPRFEKYNASQPVNGGLPQLVDLQKHLDILGQQINQSVPDPSFDGPLIFDIEEWRPAYNLNWGAKSVYQTESVKLAQTRDPTLTGKALTDKAISDFDTAARNMVVESVRLARKLRPNAKVGLYGFPYCNYDAGKAGEWSCSEKYTAFNDQLDWLFHELNAIFPSTYLSDSSDLDFNQRYIRAIYAESRRIAAKTSTPPLAIYGYTKFEYNPYAGLSDIKYYVPRDMCNSLRVATDAGLDGVLYWSTSTGMAADRCRAIANNIASLTGLYSALIIDRYELCAYEKCYGHGKCVLQDAFSSTIGCDVRLDVTQQSCVCDDGFSGDDCSKEDKAPAPGIIHLTDEDDDCECDV